MTGALRASEGRNKRSLACGAGRGKAGLKAQEERTDANANAEREGVTTGLDDVAGR